MFEECTEPAATRSPASPPRRDVGGRAEVGDEGSRSGRRADATASAGTPRACRARHSRRAPPDPGLPSLRAGRRLGREHAAGVAQSLTVPLGQARARPGRRRAGDSSSNARPRLPPAVSRSTRSAELIRLRDRREVHETTSAAGSSAAGLVPQHGRHASACASPVSGDFAEVHRRSQPSSRRVPRRVASAGDPRERPCSTRAVVDPDLALAGLSRRCERSHDAGAGCRWRRAARRSARRDVVVVVLARGGGSVSTATRRSAMSARDVPTTDTARGRIGSGACLAPPSAPDPCAPSPVPACPARGGARAGLRRCGSCPFPADPGRGPALRSTCLSIRSCTSLTGIGRNTSSSTVDQSTVATLPGHGGCGVRGVIRVDERTDPVWD